MATLSEILLTSSVRPKLVDDCIALIDSEVAAKSGLSGLAVKGAFAVVKKIKPGIIREAVNRLVDDFVGQMESFYTDHTKSKDGAGFDRFLTARTSDVADSLLGVTDKRVGRAENAVIKKAYKKLRPSGQKHVEAAVPAVARMVAGHLPN